jgi:hypothetical protein
MLSELLDAIARARRIWRFKRRVISLADDMQREELLKEIARLAAFNSGTPAEILERNRAMTASEILEHQAQLARAHEVVVHLRPRRRPF